MLTRIITQSPEAEAFDKARHELAKAFMRLAVTQGREVLDQEIEATTNLLRLSIEVREVVGG